MPDLSRGGAKGKGRGSSRLLSDVPPAAVPRPDATHHCSSGASQAHSRLSGRLDRPTSLTWSVGESNRAPAGGADPPASQAGSPPNPSMNDLQLDPNASIRGERRFQRAVMVVGESAIFVT